MTVVEAKGRHFLIDAVGCDVVDRRRRRRRGDVRRVDGAGANDR